MSSFENPKKNLPVSALPDASQMCVDDEYDSRTVVENSQQSSKIETLTFPSGLTDLNGVQNGPHVVIKAYEYKRRLTSDKGNSTPLYRIFLPMPPNIIQGYVGEYQNFSGSVIADTAANALSDTRGGGLWGAAVGAVGVAAAATVASKVSSLISNMVSNAKNNGQEIQNAFYSATSADMRNQASSISGVQLNPRYETAFNSMGPRQHSFTFPLVATNQKDSEIINKIVKQLRYSIHPSEVVGDILYSYPDKFIVEFMDHKGFPIDAIPYIPDSFVTEFSVNTMTARMHDNDPAITTISISFREQHILTRKSKVVDVASRTET